MQKYTWIPYLELQTQVGTSGKHVLFWYHIEQACLTFHMVWELWQNFICMLAKYISVHLEYNEKVYLQLCVKYQIYICLYFMCNKYSVIDGTILYKMQLTPRLSNNIIFITMNEQHRNLLSVAALVSSFGRESVDRQRHIQMPPRTT
jgi:hypothetical protein